MASSFCQTFADKTAPIMRGVINMLTYLAIGLVVQLVITFMRVCVRKVTPELDFTSKEEWMAFVLTLVIGGIINIVTWPLAIFAEAYNIVRGA